MNMNPMQIVQMLVSGGGNPMQFMQQMFGNNPNFQRAMQMTKGKTPRQMQQVAQNLCKEKGVDFENMVNQMSSMGLNVPIDEKCDENRK